ncbi:MAG: radical SAM protein [Thermoanaerobaculia bacterium]|nr:MAG: radical SAM protein [Thermoanaerobaculia bacterium]
MSGQLERVYRGAAARAVPIEVMVELTHHCNFRCGHCYIPDFSTPDRLSTSRTLELLEELAEMGTLVLALSGGELFLRRDWWTIARRARELDFDLHLFSNGSLIGDPEAARLAELDATAQISLYTLDAARFDAFVRRAGAFERVVAGIGHLRARGVRTVLKVPLMTFNYREAEAIARWGGERGCEVRTSPFVTARKDGERSPLAFRVAQEELARELGGPVLGCYDDDRVLEADAPLCAAATRYACITSSGDVMACNILPGADGNVRERSFREVWEGSPWLNRVRALRRRDLGACDTCARYSYCGRCTAQALVEDGDLTGPSSHARERAELIERSAAVERAS